MYIFINKDTEEVEDAGQYDTEEEALKGHEELKNKWSK